MHPSRKKKHYVVLALAVVLTISVFLVLNVPFIPTAVDYSELEQYSELETTERLANYSSSRWFGGYRTVQEVTSQIAPPGSYLFFGPPLYISIYYYYGSWGFSLTNVDTEGGVFDVTLKVEGVVKKYYSIYIGAGETKQFSVELDGSPTPPTTQKPLFTASVIPPKIIEQELVNKTRLVNKTQIVYRSLLQTLLGT